MDQNNSASGCIQLIIWSAVSLSVSHLGHFGWFCSFQRSNNLLTPHIPHDHFESHCRCHIGRLFAACCNTNMYVISWEMSLLYDYQYFELWCLDIIFLIFLDRCEVIVNAMLWYFIVVCWIALYMALWVWCVDPAWIWFYRQYLPSLSAFIFIRPHSSILLYVSPLSWWTFTWHNFQDNGLALINWWRVEDK